MNRDTLNQLETWYSAYTERYRNPDGNFGVLLQVKLDHSLRVAAICADIAAQLGWPAADVNLAGALGLYHDIGRYEQLRRFNTFHDAVSINHGECGYGVFSDPALRSICGAEADLLATCVRYHNRREIPADIAGRTLDFLKLIRDADKIDILHVVNETIRTGRHEENPEILLNIDVNGPANPVLVREIRETRNCSYKNMKSLIDMCLMRVAWIYGFSYLPALSMVVQRDILKDIRQVLPKTPEIVELESLANAYIAEKMAEGRPVIQ